MGRFSYITRISPPYGIMFVRLHGVHSPEVSRDRGRMLLDRIRAGGINALVYDYRHTIYTHDPFQAASLAHRISASLPAGFPIAYVFRRHHAGFVLTLMRTIARNGLVTEPFSRPRDALAWAERQCLVRLGGHPPGTAALDMPPHARSA